MIKYVGDNYNSLAINRISDLNKGQEGFEWTKQETKLYKIVVEQINDKIGKIFSDGNEMVNEEKSLRLINILICAKISKKFGRKRKLYS